MSDIFKEIQVLEGLYEEMERLERTKKSVLSSVIPASVQLQMDEVEAEFADKKKAIQEFITAQETQLKKAVVENQQSITGSLLQAVYSPGRVTWNTEALDGYIAAHPEVAQFRKQGEPYVVLKKKGAKQ